MRRAPLTLASLLVVTGCADAVSPLSFTLPGTRESAISDDAALCGRLAVSLDWKRVGGDANPFGEDVVLEGEPLVASDDNPCTFVLDDDYGFRRGSYDVLVRFLAAPGAFTGAASCAAADVEDVWVGAYAKEAVPFPDPPPSFDEADFLSRPGDESALPISGVRFDLDDDLRDNLAEVAAGSDPCVENAPPTVSLDVTPAAVDEGAPVTLTVSSTDPAALRHRVTLTLTHDQGPNAGTETITWRRFTSDPVGEELTPDKVLAGIDEDWSLVVTDATETGTGQLQATLSFVPDEPFVGTVTARLVADDGQGTVLATAPDVVFTVENVLDPPVVLMDDGAGGLVPIERFEVRETGPGVTPSTVRFKLESRDGTVDASQFTVALADGTPADVVLDDDLSFLTLTWAPTNEDVLAAPVDGYAVFLDIRGPGGVEIFPAPVRYPLAITPLFNDAPSIDTAGADTALSSGTFVAKYVRFTFVDPDESPGVPTCTPTVTPSAGTPCSAATAWDEIRCEVDGVRDGARWPFVVTLTPSSSYFTSCGADAGFTLRLSVDDVAPVGADPATPQTATTQASCGTTPGCAEDLALYTAELVSAHDVAGGPAAPALFNAAAEMIFEGKNRIGAFFADEDEDYQKTAVFLVDVSSTTPSFVHRVPRDVVCEFAEGYLRVPHNVVADEVNGRLVGFGLAGLDDAACDTTDIVFSISTAAPYAAVSWPRAAFTSSCCQYDSDCQIRPVADDGVVYLMCGDTNPQVFMLDGANNVTGKAIPNMDGDGDVYGVQILKPPGGGRYLVWPDYDGIAVIDMDTLDETTPTVERVVVPSWNSFRLGGGVADNSRGQYLFTFDPEGDGQNNLLYRITVDAGVPTLDGPLDLGPWANQSNGDLYARYLVKPYDPLLPVGESDLVVTGEPSGEVRPHVELDGPTLALGDPREVSDYYYIHEVYQSPDPRYMFGHITSSTFGSPGVKLFPWDGELPFIVQEIPGSYDWDPYYQRDVSCSTTAGVCAVMGDDALRILRFNQAPGIVGQ